MLVSEPCGLKCHVDSALHDSGGHPLASQGWPGEGMRVKGVIEKGRILLPYLILLEDHLLLDLICVFN